jgi:hypothetical protein
MISSGMIRHGPHKKWKKKSGGGGQSMSFLSMLGDTTVTDGLRGCSIRKGMWRCCDILVMLVAVQSLVSVIRSWRARAWQTRKYRCCICTTHWAKCYAVWGAVIILTFGTYFSLWTEFRFHCILTKQKFLTLVSYRLIKYNQTEVHNNIYLYMVIGG